MRAHRWVAVFILVLGIGGCASPATTMPQVVGQKLDVALSAIKSAGFNKEVEVLGGGVFGVVDKSNWQVCEQDPQTGVVVTTAPRLTVGRSCGADVSQPPSGPSTSPGTTAPAATPTQSASETVLTVANSADLAALQTNGDYCSDKMAQFAALYQGRTIQFDGSISAMNLHGDFKTRYDILIGFGDGGTSGMGPAFQFRDVNTVFDLHFTGASVPDVIKVGTNLRITAHVKSYETASCLFLLEPVSTEFR